MQSNREQFYQQRAEEMQTWKAMNEAAHYQHIKIEIEQFNHDIEKELERIESEKPIPRKQRAQRLIESLRANVDSFSLAHIEAAFPKAVTAIDPIQGYTVDGRPLYDWAGAYLTHYEKEFDKTLASMISKSLDCDPRWLANRIEIHISKPEPLPGLSRTPRAKVKKRSKWYI